MTFQMTIRTKISIVLSLLFVIAALPASASASGNIFNFPAAHIPSFAEQVNKNEIDQPAVLRELSIEDLITLPIVQQPDGNITFVSTQQNAVTEYQATFRFGTVGLLAHNFLAGRYFSNIFLGQGITLLYSDGIRKKYMVTEIQQYQALRPESPSSDFIDLTNGKHLTASQLFKKTYGSNPGQLILQTCISAEQNPSWGRLFIIAEPVS